MDTKGAGATEIRGAEEYRFNTFKSIQTKDMVTHCEPNIRPLQQTIHTQQAAYRNLLTANLDCLFFYTHLSLKCLNLPSVGSTLHTHYGDQRKYMTYF